MTVQPTGTVSDAEVDGPAGARPCAVEALWTVTFPHFTAVHYVRVEYQFQLRRAS